MKKRIVFMGSPEFAVPTLQSLIHNFNVIGVVTQPDRPAGRGRTLTPPPVKTLALENDLPVIQPARIREPDAMQKLQAWQPDVIVVAAFGQILRQQVLDMPAHGCINVHASLLPRWRGAAPIQAAILHGDSHTGVSIMRMDAGIDTGPVYCQKAIDIHPEDTSESLGKSLANCGADLLVETLPDILDGSLIPQPQDENLATYASMLKKEDGLLDFSQPAQSLVNKIRAYYSWPGAFTSWQEQPLKILKAYAVTQQTTSQPSGKRIVFESYPAITTSDGCLVLETLQPAGKKAMDGKVFLTGARNWIE